MINLVCAKLLKEYIEMALSEVTDCYDKFNIGQLYAYVEILELLQQILNESEREEIGLDYCIEDIYPLT